MVRVIHITPELPPTVGGVADYTAILSRRLVEVSGGGVEPVLVHAGKESAEKIEVNFPVVEVGADQSAGRLTRAVQELAHEPEQGSVLLLEYSGYGYAKRGAPIGLVRGLRRVCRKGGLPLFTIFHELYATGPPWKSAFWMSPLQRFVVAWLARMSVGIVTNRFSAVPWLRRYRSSESVSIKVQPVFSNVGEPGALPKFSERDRHTVVFGGSGRKSAIYDGERDLLRHLIGTEHFSRVLDIGPEGGNVPSEESWSRQLGILEKDEVSDRLLSVMLGILSYPGSRLGKSGVAAAFASHGVPFLLIDEEEKSLEDGTDPYVEGEHFLRVDSVKNTGRGLTEKRLAEMSRSIRNLYENRLHSTHAAQCFLRLFTSATDVISSDKAASFTE